MAQTGRIRVIPRPQNLGTQQDYAIEAVRSLDRSRAISM